MKNASKILALLGGASVLAVMANLPIDANGFFLTDEQMDKLDASIDANEAVVTQLEAANAEVTRLTAELATAQAATTDVSNQLATAQSKITELEAMDGPVSGTHKDADDFESESSTDPMSFDFQQEILNRFKI